MASIVVRGGIPLAGSVRVSGSKNASLPILAACLLNEQPVTLHNVPELHDVGVIGEVLRSLGARCGRNASGDLRVDAAQVSGFEPPYELVNKMRASFLVLGPLLARFGEASVPLPGGCAIGARPVGEHLEAMRALGAEVTQESGRIVARANKLIGAEIYLNMVSVGASENAHHGRHAGRGLDDDRQRRRGARGGGPLPLPAPLRRGDRGHRHATR